MDRARSDRLDPIPGNPPSPLKHPTGCVFHPRCKYTDLVPDRACFEVRPELLPSDPDHLVRCHLPIETRRKIAAEVLESLTGAPVTVAGAPPTTGAPGSLASTTGSGGTAPGTAAGSPA
jgi:oligopeptide/dipeptide ABC transporter ATP-binding protein